MGIEEDLILGMNDPGIRRNITDEEIEKVLKDAKKQLQDNSAKEKPVRTKGADAQKEAGKEKPSRKEEKTGGEKASRKEEKTGGEKASRKEEKTGGEKTSRKEEKTGGEKASRKEEKTGGEKVSRKEEKTGEEKASRKEEKTGGEKISRKEEKNGGEKVSRKEEKTGRGKDKKVQKQRNEAMQNIVSAENTAEQQRKNILDEAYYVREPKKRFSFGSVVGMTLEVIWTVVKLAVLVVVITGIVGFCISRDMMMSGKNRTRQCLDEMTVSQTAAETLVTEKAQMGKWLAGIKKEKLTMEADDGSILVARQMKVYENSSKWVVLLHGYNGSMEDVYDIAMHYSKDGYNVLLPDLRSCGESEGAFQGMGWLDRLDVINWIDVILEDNPSAQVVVHGVDMGADAALMLTGEPVKSSVKAVIADGAYTSAWDVMKKEYKTRHKNLPAFPIFNMVNPVLKIWAGYSLKEADAVKQVRKDSSIPVLLIHGSEDTYADAAMTDKLDKAIAASHKRLDIQGGTHEDNRYADNAAYYKGVFDFLDAYVK